MRRVGLILLAIGVAGFALASYESGRYAPPAEGSLSGPASPPRARDAWEDARWLLTGTAVMGAVFTALPGRRE